jgi:hypothetical protein
MPSDHPYGVQEGQLVRVAAGLAAGLIDQLAQREVDQQQAVDLLLHQVGPAAAQHQPLAGQAHFEFGEDPLALPALMIQGGQLGRGGRDRVEQGGDQPIQRLGSRHCSAAIRMRTERRSG